MKLNQIITENEDLEITEAPVGFAQRMMTNLGAKLGLSSSKVGKEVNDEIMKTYNQLKSFMRGSNINQNELMPEDMKQFLNKIGYDKNADNIIKSVKRKYKSKPKERLYTREIEEIILLAVSQAYKEKAEFQKGKYTDQPVKSKSRPSSNEIPFKSTQADRAGSFRSDRAAEAKSRPTPEKVAEFLKTMSQNEKDKLRVAMNND